MQPQNTRFLIFSERLREAMKRKSLTQKQLESISNVTQSSISAYLRGDMEPKISVFYQLAVALDVSMEWLLGVETEPLSPDSDSLIQAQQEITRLKTKLRKAKLTIRGAFSVALEALDLEEDQEN